MKKNHVNLWIHNGSECQTVSTLIFFSIHTIFLCVCKEKRVIFNGRYSYSAALCCEPRRHMFKVHSIHLRLAVNLGKPHTLRAMRKDASTACSLACRCLRRQATARFKGSANNHDCGTEPHRRSYVVHL